MSQPQNRLFKYNQEYSAAQKLGVLIKLLRVLRHISE